MCARKLKYAAGDDLRLYATPKESLEASRKETEEEERWKQVIEEQERLKKLTEGQNWIRRNQCISYQDSSVRYNGNRIVSAPVSMLPEQLNHNHNSNGYNTSGNFNSVENMENNHSIPPTGQVLAPRQHKIRPPPIPIRRSNGSTFSASPQHAAFNNNAGVRSGVNGDKSRSSSPKKLVSPNAKDSSTERDIKIAKQLFHNHDIKRKGRLTAEGLQNLLQNDDSSRFCISSIESIIEYFGQSRFGTINETEFISLYQKIKYWRKIYVDNDINHSLSINVTEYYNCLQELKYLIPFEISEKLFNQYAEFNINKTNLNSKELKFDKFVESLIWLMKLTKMFRKYDVKHDGVANIAYKDFIETTLYLGRFLSH